MKIRIFESDSKIPDCDADWSGSGDFISKWLLCYGVLVEDAEKFISRSLSETVSKSADLSDFKEESRMCIGQEVQHASAHRRLNQIVATRYRFKGIVKILNFISYSVIEPLLTQRLKMTFVAGLEHINAAMAVRGLESDLLKSKNFFSDLFCWHFYEELEHKQVSFEICERLRISKITKSLVMIILLFMFLVESTLLTVVFAFQDRSIFSKQFWQGMFFFFSKNGFGFYLINICLKFGSFNPRQWPDATDFSRHYLLTGQT